MRLRLFEQEQALRVKKQQEDSKRNARNKRRRERPKETSTNDPLDGEEDNIIPKRQRHSKTTKEQLEHLLLDLESRFERKCWYSANFPPRVSLDTKKKCMNAFQEATSEKHLPICTCAICGQLTSDELLRLVLERDKILKVLKDTSGKLIVDKCGKIGRQYRICNTCDGSLKCGNCPKAAIFNGFVVGCNHDMPAYLKNLTETEEMFIAKSRPFGKV